MSINTLLLGNTVQSWLIAIVVFFTCDALLLAIRSFSVSRLTALSKRTSTRVDDLLAYVLARTRGFFLVAVSLAAASTLLTLPPAAYLWGQRLLVIVVFAQIGLWATAGGRFALGRYRDDKMEEDRGAATMVVALGFLLQVAIWSVVLLLALDNLGVNVSALVAGLGVGGIAIALAVQNILGDLFASLAIILDRPFVLGDFIIVDDKVGTVEHIGLKTTRVRAISGEQLVFSNADLLGSRVRNFGRMQHRRIVFSIGVTYQTSHSLLEQIPGIIRAAIELQEDVRFDRCHLSAYGDFSINFESVFFVLTADYNRYMDVQQAIYLRLHEQFGEHGIDFAYPTQTLFMARA